MAIPRWISIFKEVLSENKDPTYTLSTVISSPSGPLPRSRSVIHRGVISPSPCRPLLLTTTDIRTPKAHQLHANANSEATFWIPASQVQFRIVASAYLLPHPAHAWYTSFPGKELSTDGDNAQFDWDNTRLEAFDSLSGHLRASFVRPVPGTLMKRREEAYIWPETAPKRGQAEGAEQRVVDEALNNFALVVLDPCEVEFLELAPLPNRRTKWIKEGEQWNEQLVVP